MSDSSDGLTFCSCSRCSRSPTGTVQVTQAQRKAHTRADRLKDYGHALLESDAREGVDNVTDKSIHAVLTTDMGFEAPADTMEVDEEGAPNTPQAEQMSPVEQAALAKLNELLLEMRDPSTISPNASLVFTQPPHLYPLPLPRKLEVAQVDELCTLDPTTPSNGAMHHYLHLLTRATQLGLSYNRASDSSPAVRLKSQILVETAAKYRSIVRRRILDTWQAQAELSHQEHLVDTSGFSDSGHDTQ